MNIFDIFRSNSGSSCLNLTKNFNITSDNIVKSQEVLPSYNDQDIIEYAEDCYKKIFNVKYVNIKPHTRIIANRIVFRTILNIKSKVCALKQLKNDIDIYEEESYFDLSKYNTTYFDIDRESQQINYENIKNIILKEKPNIIYINTSYYPRNIDYEELGNISKQVDSYLIVDISDISGLVAADLVDNPCKYADIVITSTYGSLRGLQSGIILSNNEELIKKIDIDIDLYQGSPLINMIASKTVVANNILNSEFINYQKQSLNNSKVLCDIFKNEEIKVVYNGTDNQDVIIDVKTSINMTGKEAETILKNINIICNKTLIPYDETTPYITGGLKFNTLVMTSRGLKEKDFLQIGKIIVSCLKNNKDSVIINNLKKQVIDLIGELLW